MLYYKVKASADNKNIYHNRLHIGFLVGGELITQGELNRIWYNEIPMSYLDPVIIPKGGTYWFFGCRFETLPSI